MELTRRKGSFRTTTSASMCVASVFMKSVTRQPIQATLKPHVASRTSNNVMLKDIFDENQKKENFPNNFEACLCELELHKMEEFECRRLNYKHKKKSPGNAISVAQLAGFVQVDFEQIKKNCK